MSDGKLTGWRKVVAEVGHDVEVTIDDLKHGIRSYLGYGEPIHVQLYRGYGTARKVNVMGRVLEKEGPGAPEPDEPVWENVARIYKAFESDEIPGARLRVRFDGEERELRADREGYFDTTFTRGDYPRGVTRIEADLIAPASDSPKQRRHFDGEIFVPPADCGLIVVSDVDDTVMYTQATNLLMAAFNTLRHNAYHREAFPGVGAFYRGLRDGPTNASFFYLTSSAWNVYDVMRVFFEHADIPAGPILMRDLGLSDGKLLKGTHTEHKLARVQELMDLYPERRFLLIGDTGQHDAEIYRDAVRNLAGQGRTDQVAAVYLRDVSPEDRDANVQDILDDIESHGVPALADESSRRHAEHAAGLGLIDADRLPAVR